MPIFVLRRKLCIEGIMPERALLKLKRANIPLFHVKKTSPKTLEFCVNAKDTKKVFAIYPKVCYNKSDFSAYSVRDLGSVGLAKPIEKLKNRVGFLIGALLFALTTAYMDNYIFAVDFVGSSVYARETLAALEENGIKQFSLYQKGNEDLICAQLLRLKGVEYVAIKKSGMRLKVEMRLYDLPQTTLQQGDLIASHTGKVQSITALRGTAAKKVGEEIRAGEPLAYGWYLNGAGEQVRVETIARAQIACTYEEEIATETAEQAFAEAYLKLNLADGDEVTRRQVEEVENGYLVHIEYTAIERINM